jgi:GxxExxY protein
MDVPVARLAFDIKDVDFAAVPRIAAAAIARVALEETASVSEMSLSRSRTFGLQSRIGLVRWRIAVQSGHEQAAAFANAVGRLTGASLAGTLRAARYNLYEDSHALADAVHALSDAFDGNAQLSQAIIYDKMVRFEVVLARDTGRTEWRTADIDGAHRETYQSSIAIAPLTPTTPFGAGDVEWTALPRLQQIARQLSDCVIGCAFGVMNKLGRGFLKKVYENALAHELRKEGLSVAQQYGIKVRYDDIIVGEYTADLLVEGAVVVELNAVKTLDSSTHCTMHRLPQCEWSAAMSSAQYW